ncbi:MAG: sensor histidine kinase [Herminiimonas sp.]|nr:sensor histidine kinase [Herminiimonas sp.]
MNPSIRLTLLKRLIGPILLINLIGAGLTFWLAWAPTQIAWDQSLADAAWALVPRLKESDGAVSIDLPQQAEQVLRVDHFDSIFFVVRSMAGNTLAGDHDFPALSSDVPFAEPHTSDGIMRNESVRIITLKTTVGSHTLLIGAAETLRKRTHSRWVIIITLLLLEALLTCVAVTIVWFAVKKGLQPLQQMQDDLNRRQPSDLSPVAEPDAPVELAPLLTAVNGLLQRAQDGALARQNFLANVAHQLRTPLAGVKINLEWQLQRYAGDSEATQTTGMLLQATERMIRQTNQLLALARAEPSQLTHSRFEVVRLDALVADAVQPFVQQADLRRIDLGFELQPAAVWGDRFLLRDLVDNLIDNAIRYSPIEGTVTVRCWQDATCSVLVVEDNGPGIAETHREAVFNRFYRIDDTTAGSGLGLAIVRDIVIDHGASTSIEAGPGSIGTHFRVAFPARSPHQKKCA